MNKFLTFLKQLDEHQQIAFARACGTSIGYLKKACYRNQRFGPELCIEIEKNSFGQIRCEDLRPEVDWGFLRKSKIKAAAA